MVSLTVYSVVIFSYRYLDSDRILSKRLYSWLFIGLSEHHHAAHTSMKKNKLKGASTMLNNVFNNTP